MLLRYTIFTKRSDELLRSTIAVVIGVTRTSQIIACTFGNGVLLQAASVSSSFWNIGLVRPENKKTTTVQCSA